GDVRRNGLHADPEEGVLRVAGLDQLRGDGLDGVDRNREADPDVPTRLALDLRGDADHPALRVEQRAARVALVDGRVGVDHVAWVFGPVWPVLALQKLDPGACWRWCCAIEKPKNGSIDGVVTTCVAVTWTTPGAARR